MPDIRGAVHILAQCKGGAPAFQHQRGKIGKAFFQQSPALGQRAGIFFVIVDGTQHRAVAAGGTQPGQYCPKIGFRYLTQHFAAQAGRHSLHLLPDGRELSGQLAVAAPGVGHAQGHAGRQQTVCVDLFHLRCGRVCEVGKNDAAHRAGQLVQLTAGFAKVSILRILADAGQCPGIQPTGVLPVPDAGHAHLKGRRAGKAAAPQNVAGRVSIKAANSLSRCTEALGNAPDQAGRVGALPFLRLCRGQVDHIQLVEPAGLDPHIAVRVPGRYRHQIQRDRRRQPVAVLVVGVVAAQLRTPRGRVHLHLPPRAKIQLELLQRRAVPRPLPGQFLRGGAVKRGKGSVPPPCRDLFPELCAGCHPRSLPETFKQCL